MSGSSNVDAQDSGEHVDCGLMGLDTAGLYFRAFHAVPDKITDPSGAPINAVRGFCDMTAEFLREYRPSGLVAARDENWRPRWRVDLVPEYKAARVGEDGAEDAPEALHAQVPLVWELLDALGVPVGAIADGEADDVLAALPIAGAEVGTGQTVIVTGDRDLLQIARSDRRVLYIGAGMKKRKLYGPADVAERIGIPAGEDARLYADYAVLVGDASDGLPGVAGIGAKGAAKLVTEHGDVEGILAAAADESVAMPARQRTNLLYSAEYVRAAKQIVALGARDAEPELVGAADGSLGPVDSAALERLIERTGQERAIGNLVEALEPLR
ncbi:5'-3' exonuclease [Dietzia sp.]|uniref:5'-3' exonuclease n=1 Tax=Dietzia sp. TaxID=1871616 RepID=UPI002FDB1987